MPYCTICGTEVDSLDAQNRCSECSALEDSRQQGASRSVDKVVRLRRIFRLIVLLVAVVLAVIVMVALAKCIFNAPPRNFAFVKGRTIGEDTISDFYISMFELTNAQWNAVMGTIDGNNYPKTDVSWVDAIEYCNLRSQREGLPPCYSYLDYGTDPNKWPEDWKSNTKYTNKMKCNFLSTGYRLPTVAEWRYAARGGQKGHGYKYSGSNLIDEVGWCKENCGGSTHPVGTKKPNELGIYDMSGNVSEWCWDIGEDMFMKIIQGYLLDDRMVMGGDHESSESGCEIKSGIGINVNTCQLVVPNFLRGNTVSTYSYAQRTGFRLCRTVP